MSEAVAGAGFGGSGFRARTMILLLVVAAAAALGFVALSAYAPQMRLNSDPGAHPLSRSAVGYAGLVQLLKDTGRPVVVSRGTPGAKGLDLLILTPPMGVDDAQIDALTQRAGVVLIVAPKWFVGPNQTHPGWATDYGPLPPKLVRIAKREDLTEVQRAAAKVSPVLVPPAEGDPWFAPGTAITFGPVDRFQTLAQGKARIALADAAGHGVLLRAPAKPRPRAKGQAPAAAAADDDANDGPTIYVLTDPDLFNNKGMADLATARGAVALIDALRGRNGSITFDATLNGFRRTRSILKMAFEPPFLAATLCVLGAALLVGWRSATNFGAVARRGRGVALGKEALVDATAGLIRMNRRQPHMAQRYVQLIKSSVLAATGAREGEGADAHLDRLAEAAGKTPFTQLAAEAAQVKSGPGLMQATRALFQWKSEVERGRH